MRQIILILLLITLALGGCAVTVRSLQPAIEQTAHAWVQAETRTDPVDDLVRFRQSERSGRAGSILLPVFALLSLALLLLLLAAPLPRILKELRLLRKASHKTRRYGPPSPSRLGQPWLEQPERGQFPPPLPGHLPPENQPLLPPPHSSGWLESE